VKLWEFLRNLGLEVTFVRLINSRTINTKEGTKMEGAAFMCMKDEDAAMHALYLFKKDRFPFRCCRKLYIKYGKEQATEMSLRCGIFFVFSAFSGFSRVRIGVLSKTCSQKVLTLFEELKF
jgi:hypothetical protein